jgi:hypothetical protein
MLFRFGTVLFGLSVLGSSLPLFGDAGPIERVQTTNTERMNLAPGGTVRVNDSFGHLTVEGWDRPEVEVIVVKSTTDYIAPADQKGQDKAKKRLEDLHITTERGSANDVTIATAGGRHNLTAEYEIHVPRDVKLVIHHRVGFVLVTDVAGDIEAKARRGDIVLMLRDPSAFAIDAKCKLGNVSSDLAGDIHLKYFVGERFSSGKETAHKLYLRMGFGGITIKQISREAVP